MNTCAYCGREITPKDFICANCSDPQDGTKNPPTEAQPVADKVTTTADGETTTKLNSRDDSKTSLATEESKQKLSIDAQSASETIDDSSPDEPQKSDWKNEPLHEDFKVKKITYTIIFLFVPTLMIIGTIAIWIMQKITSVSYILPFAIIGLVFGYFVFQSSMNLLRFSSWVFKNVEPVDVYIYLDQNPNRAEPIQIRIYDDDNMYPSLSKVGSIHVLKGFILDIGLINSKPETLVPVTARVGRFESMKVIILEANDKRVWCRWRAKS